MQMPGHRAGVTAGRNEPFTNLGSALTSGAAGTLTAALLAAQDPHHKVGAHATVTTIGALVAVVSTIVAGTLSDHTRGRTGRGYQALFAAAAVIALAGAVLVTRIRRVR